MTGRRGEALPSGRVLAARRLGRACCRASVLWRRRRGRRSRTPTPQRELQAVQELLAARHRRVRRGRSRAAPSCCFDDIVTRLESLRRQGALPAARPRDPGPGLRAARRARTTTSACRRRRPTASARWSSSSRSTRISKDKVSPKVVDYFNSVKKALVGYLAVSSQAGRRARLAERRVPGPDRLLPAGGAGRRVHGRGRARGLPHGDAHGQHRAQGHRDARRWTLVRTAGQRVLRHRAGRRRGLGGRRSCARPPSGTPRARPARTLARGQGPRPRARLGAHRGRRTSRWARTWSSSGGSATRR